MQKILYVEDSPDARCLVQRLLSDRYLVLEAEDGLTGIEVASAEEPALILMDINIPLMDGYEVTTKLKSLRPEVPVVALTADVSDGARQRALAAGCDGYIPKPIDPDQFLVQVEAFLKGKREVLEQRERKVYAQAYQQKLVDRLEGKVRELTIRNRIADIFLTIPDEEMYGEVLQVILEAMESKWGVFGYFDEDGNLVAHSITRDVWDQRQIPNKDIVFSHEAWDSIWGRAMIEKKTLYSNEPFRVPEGHIPVLRAMTVPIVHQGELIGVITVANKATDYDENDKKLLEIIAGSIAPILHARLQRDKQKRERARAEETLKRRLEQLASLSRASQAVTASLELDQVLAEIVSLTSEVVTSDYASVVLVDKEGRLGRSVEYLPGVPAIERRVRAKGFTHWIVHSRQAIIVDDIDEDGTVNPRPSNGAPCTANPLLVEAGVRSFVGLPLVAKDRLLGVLYLRSLRPNNFRDQLPLLTTFTNQMALAIENARIYEEERKRVTQLELISGVIQRIAFILDLDELLPQVAHLIGDTFGYYYTGILLVEADSNELILRAISGPFETQIGRLRLKIGREGVAGWVAHSGEPLLVNDVSREPKYYPAEESKDTKSELAVPIKFQGEIIGVLDVQNVELDAFSQDDVSILQTLADQLAIAIVNARLYEAEAQRRREAETLRQAAMALTATLNLEEALDRILEQLHRVVAYDDASVQLLQDDHLEIVGRRGFAAPSVFIGFRFLVPGDNPHTHVVESGEPVILADVRAAYAPFRELPHDHFRSWLGVPMRFRERIIGMIALDSREPDYFTADHARLAAAFANQAAIAIVNARLFQETQQRVQELTTLQQVSVKLTAALSKPKDLLKTIVDSAVSTIPTAERGIIHLVDPASQELWPEVWFGIDSRTIGRTRMKVGKSVAGYAIAVGELVNVPDTSLDGRFQLHPQSNGHCKSLLVAPMLIGSEKIGTISVDSPKANAFTSDDERLLTALATHAAYAIQNARLFNQTMAYATTLEKLAEASKKLIAYTDLDELFTFAAQQGAQIFGAEDCSLFVKNKLKETIRKVASICVPLDVFPEYEVSMGSKPGVGLTPFVAATGQILNFVGDTFKDHPAWKGKFQDHLRYFPSGACHSLLIAPLEGSEGEIVGVVKLENKSGEEAARGFSEFEKKIFRTFASQVGIAIERAQLFQKITELARESERERLREDLHDAMTSVHALIMLEAERVLELVQAQKYQEAENGLRDLWKNARFINFSQLGRLLEDLRDPILVDKGLAVALQNHVGRIKAFEVQLDIQGRGRLPFRIEHVLYRIAQQALGNVAKHAYLDKVENGRAQVTLAIESESVTLTIADNGIGFDAKKELERRDALGLSVMKRWARSIDAQFEIISHLGKGTTVRVVAPLEGEKEMRP